MKSKLGNGQAVGICLAVWAAVKNLLPETARVIIGFLVLNLMFLLAVGVVSC